MAVVKVFCVRDRDHKKVVESAPSAPSASTFALSAIVRVVLLLADVIVIWRERDTLPVLTRERGGKADLLRLLRAEANSVSVLSPLLREVNTSDAADIDSD